jgi:hypothetical protein
LEGRTSKALRRKKSFAASQLHHFRGLGTIQGDGFLHEHMFACVEGQCDPLMVHIVRRGHVDHIEIVRSDKLVVVAIGSLERHARGEFLSSVFAPRTDGHYILLGVGTYRLNEPLGDPT